MKRLHAGYARLLLILLTLLFLVSAHSLSAAAVARSFDIKVGQPVAEVVVTLTSKSGTHNIELRNFGPQADPVVYLLPIDREASQIGSAAARDGRLAFTVPGSLAGTLRVVVRSRSAQTPQSGEVWIDGALKASNLSYATGEVVRLDRLASNEKVLGIRQPLGPSAHIAYLMSLDGMKILRRGAGVTTALSPPSTDSVLAVYATNTLSVTGPLRVYRNDAARDSDGDGLGDQLETALGTCAKNSGSVAGANCNEIADSRDTDGDGLQDGWEVLGKDYRFQDGNVTTSGHLALPAWGANPRHKDIFVEIDFRRLNYQENLAGRAEHMPAETARQMAGIYGDTATTDFFLKAAHAVSVDNPDRLPGISLHLDTGVAPERPEDATIYGDWGGYNPVDAVPDPTDPGWDAARDVRLIGDISNDGKADIVGFGAKGVMTALAKGDGGFLSEQFAFGDFGPNQGWDPAKHVRLLADINNDGKADIVAFGDAGVWTALATGDGKFEPPKFVLANFGYNQGWRNDKHVRLLADINNDGKADIVAFGDAGVWTALATGDGGFAPEQFVLANLGYDQGWRPEKHVRLVADINNDNRADIVAFGDAGVWTALSNGAGGFAPEQFVLANFGFDQGWRSDKHVRLLADLNNDKKADIVAFGDAGVWTAISNGAGGFTPEQFVLADLGYDQGWRPEKHVRLVADINNDDMADIVGFGDAGVWTAVSNGAGGFSNFTYALADFGYDQGWRVGKHVRLLGDINNDGMADIVGFGDGGVWTALALNGGFAPLQFVSEGFGSAKYIPQKPEVVWHEQMSPGRRGIFHYVMGYTTGGGSCGEGIACGFNMTDAGNSAHEFGHTIGLDHNGPYTVSNEPNCKPNYPSLMNYAYLGSGYRQFSDGRNFPNFNNHALTETGAVDPSNQPLLNALDNTFKYKVDRTQGNVDWNRDGQFSPAGTMVRAYANYQPGGECEFTRQGQQDTGIKSKRSAAMVRFGNSIWVFAVDLDGKLAVTHAAPAWNCGGGNIDACPTAQFASVAALDMGELDALDARTMMINGQETVVVVGIRPDGTLFETTLTLSGGVENWSAPQAIAGSLAAGEPSLANNIARTSLALAYRGRDNKVRVRFRNAQGWSAETQPMAGGQPIAMHPNASPAVVFAALPVGIVAQGEHLVGAFTDPQGRLQLMTPQTPGSSWARIAIPYDMMSGVIGRPVMAWTGGDGGGVVNASTAAAAPSTTFGRLYILYIRYAAPPAGHPYPVNPMRMAMSYVDRATGKLTIGLDSYYDNEWAYAYGMSLVTPSDGGALRGGFTSAVQPQSQPPQEKVFFNPHADGISDLGYNNYDDWKTLAHDSCTVVTGQQTDSPVHCAAPW